MVFLLDVDPKISLKRISDLRQEIPNQFEKLDTLNAVRDVFNEIEKDDDEIWKIDGTRSIEDIHSDIINLLLENALKEKLCAKDYGCHDFINCTYRITDNCDWFKLQKNLAR